MNPEDFADEHVLAFAKALGFDGTDEDLFYESYYQLDNESYEQELDLEESWEY